MATVYHPVKADGYTVTVSRNCITLWFQKEHIVTICKGDDKWATAVELLKENNLEHLLGE